MLLTKKEENYMRVLLLLETGRKAVRMTFDKEFHPARLKETIQRFLKSKISKNLLTKEQKDILERDALTSGDFDIPLMMMLLKHVADFKIGDLVPLSSNIKTHDDLSRIKYFRNFIAHLKSNEVSDDRFLEIQENVSQSINRLAEDLTEDCQNILCGKIDLLNHDVRLKINNIMKEIPDLKSEFVHLKDEFNRLKDFQSDPVPPNVRVQFKKQLGQWMKGKKTFVPTKAARGVIKQIKKNHSVAIIGSFGVGKTTILRHVAVTMEQDGFYIIPVTSVLEIDKYKNPYKKCLFVVDDFCGKFSLETEELENWKHCSVEVSETCKIIVSCRLQVYLGIINKELYPIKFVECNLNSANLRLSEPERLSIAEMYGIDRNTIGDCLLWYDCFPRLCSAYDHEYSDFFQKPYSIFEWELDMLERNSKFCALLLLVMFNNKFRVNYVSSEASQETKMILEHTYDICKVKIINTNQTILTEFDTLIHTFVKREGDSFTALDEHILHLLLTFFSQRMMRFIIEYASCEFVHQRIKLGDPKTDVNEFTLLHEHESSSYVCSETAHIYAWDLLGKNTVLLQSEYHADFIKRMVNDWEKGYVNAVLANGNFRHFQFFSYITTLSISKQVELVKKVDKIDGSTPLLAYISCERIEQALGGCGVLGPWFIRQGAEVNKCDIKGYTPLIRASMNNSLEFVKLLITAQADLNKNTYEGFTALHMACYFGYCDIVNRLLAAGADCNKCALTGMSPLQMACFGGENYQELMFTNIAKDLLRYEANVNHLNTYGFSALFYACLKGYTRIVNNLLKRKADVNISFKFPVQANVNISSKFHQMSLLHSVCLNRDNNADWKCSEIAISLLRNGADVNSLDQFRCTPLHYACIRGNARIVGELLQLNVDVKRICPLIPIKYDDGTRIETCSGKGFSPLQLVIIHKGNASKVYNNDMYIIKKLLRHGVDVNFTHDGFSALHYACMHGHTEIVKELLKYHADVSKTTKDGLMPKQIAFMHGNIDIWLELIHYNRAIALT